jgi:hypothetical protein
MFDPTWIRRSLSALAFSLLLASPRPLLAKLDPGAEKAARDYLLAFSRNDRPAMKRLTPTQPANFYGPFMFKRLPRLKNPRVDAHRAAIDFEGESIDARLSPRGTITLVKLDERETEAWVVRQVLWYDKEHLPLGVRLPKESVTKADQEQESEVRQSARAFLVAWQGEDYERMNYLSFDWLSRENKDPPKLIKLRKLQFSEAGRLEGATRVEYQAQLTLLGFIPHRANGFLYLLKEGEDWKVRGSHVSF